MTDDATSSFRVPVRHETDRLLLRQPRGEDWRALHAYLSDEETVRFTMRKPLTEAETWRFVCTLIGHWSVRGYGPYVMVDKDGGDVVGMIGFWYPLDWPGPEILWTLGEPHRGKGFASEAVRALQALARECLPGTAFISLIHPENQPSIHVAKAVGARLRERVEFRGEPVLIYHHPP